MEPNGNPVIAKAAYGYDRAAVDAFFAAVTGEQQRLERLIADARARAARAQEALDGRRILVAMVSEACDDIAAKHRQAELVAGHLGRRVASSPADAGLEVALGPVVWRLAAENDDAMAMVADSVAATEMVS